MCSDIENEVVRCWGVEVGAAWVGGVVMGGTQ